MITIILARRASDIPADVLKQAFNTLIVHPENDKHPTDQVKWLIDLIKPDIYRYFTIKTNSEHIVSALGQLIAANKLSKGLISINIYEGGKLERCCSFNDSGALENWPYGWFLPNPEFIDNFNY